MRHRVHADLLPQDTLIDKLVVTELITLDGAIEDPGGAQAFEKGGWAFKFKRGDAGDECKVDELMASDAQLLGRVTCAGFARASPAMNTDEFGQKMNRKPKYMVSITQRDADATWSNSTVIPDDVSGQLARVKTKLRGDIVVAGSAQLARHLFEYGCAYARRPTPARATRSPLPEHLFVSRTAEVCPVP